MDLNGIGERLIQAMQQNQAAQTSSIDQSGRLANAEINNAANAQGILFSTRPALDQLRNFAAKTLPEQTKIAEGVAEGTIQVKQSVADSIRKINEINQAAMDLNRLPYDSTFITQGLGGFNKDVSGVINQSLLNRAQQYNDAANILNSGLNDDSLNAFASSLRQQESSGNYTAIGPQTQYGTAKGAYQFLDSTWQSALARQAPDLLGKYSNAAQAPKEVQDKVARGEFRRLYGKYKDWNLVAMAWHAGEGTADNAYAQGVTKTGAYDQAAGISTNDYISSIINRANIASAANPSRSSQQIAELFPGFSSTPVARGGYFGADRSSYGIAGGHQGVDFSIKAGTRVNSIMDGVVQAVETQPLGGLIVRVKHPNGHYSQYSHLSSATVKPGDRVKAGQQVAASGSSGSATTGPHLDFMALDADFKPVNPRIFLGDKK